MGLVGVTVLVLLLSATGPATADHRPKHQKGTEEAPLAADDSAVEGVDTVIEPETQIGDPSVGGESVRTDAASGKKVADSTGEASASRPKPDKEKTTKEKNAAATVDPKESKAGCGNDQCHKSTAGETQTTSGLSSDSSGTVGVVVPHGSSSSRLGEGDRISLSRLFQATRGEGSGSTAQRRSGLNGADVLAVTTAQPSLALVVDALNDADGDGIYSDSETAPASGTDVSFKAIITNMGSTAFEIATVSQSFMQPGGRVQVEVCADLDGLTLAFGESLACSFDVSDYSPPLGKTAVNTVTASGIEIAGSKKRGTSDSDNTTVATFLEDQVLAVAIERAPGPLAFTGTGAARLLALALVLLAAGGSALYLSSVRERRPVRPVLRLGSWRGVSRLTLLGTKRTPPTEKTARK